MHSPVKQKGPETEPQMQNATGDVSAVAAEGLSVGSAADGVGACGLGVGVAFKSATVPSGSPPSIIVHSANKPKLFSSPL